MSCQKLSNREKWAVLKSLFDEKGLVRQHLDSYNNFIEFQMQSIVDESGEVIPDIPGFKIEFGKIKIGIPKIREVDGATMEITPIEARIRELSYAADILLEMTPITIDERTQREEAEETLDIYIGKLPIMLKCCRCPLESLSDQELIDKGEDPLDPGGYFIINGTERVLVTQEELASNRILAEEASRSSSATHFARVLSTNRGFRAPLLIERKKDGTLRVSFPSVPGKIPLAVLMRALGLYSDREIFQAISENEEIQKELIPVIDIASEIQVLKDPEKSQQNALDYVGKRVAIGQTKDYRIRRALQVLDRYLLPHIGNSEEDRIKKAYYLGQMAQKVMELALGLREPDDKDQYHNKRLDLAGELFTSLFRVAFLNLVKDIRYQLERSAVRGRAPNIRTAVRADVITERIRHALATGNWVGGKAGVSQLLKRDNYIGTLSHLRRVNSPLSRSQSHFEARDLHPTQWGKMCPAETPEGPNCGLVKNLGLAAIISVGVDERIIENILYDLGVIPINEVNKVKGDKVRVFLNGKFIGIHQQHNPFIRRIREKRRKGEIGKHVNIGYYQDSEEIQINCDGGRVTRPLFVIKNNMVLIKKEDIEKLEENKYTWSHLVQKGIIEYLDTEEEENAYIAMFEEDITAEHTHLEISPAAILGICASVIPFPEYNASTRNTFEAGMVKQALGLFAANLHLRFDTRGHTLHYPQQALVKTSPMEIIGINKRPAGQNFIIAMMSFEGFNIEDAIIINKASIERGIARSHFFRTYNAAERKYPGGEVDKFEIPDRSVRGFKSTEFYRLLSEEDGIIEPETQVNGGDVLIGRTSPPRFIKSYGEFELIQPNRRETSQVMRHNEKGIVDTVIISENVDGNKLIKIKVRDLRIPEIGDKFSSRHGQKGILGLVVDQCDMPFTSSGVIPDIIVNPHAIPSRMTLGQLFEGISGKIASTSGQLGDATAFEWTDITNLQEQLVGAGFEFNGREVMYNGMTGEKYDVGIFCAPIYYQKLHHLVVDKVFARARGRVQILTRQPTEGRSREGGLRFGEMERDCLIAHGAALLLKERLLDESDRVGIWVCEKCGFLAVFDRNRDRRYCPICGDNTVISNVICSYAFKLLLQEMMSLGLAPRLKLKEKV